MKHRIREKAIFDLLDGELEGRKRLELERHLAECAQCRLFYLQVKTAQGELHQLVSTTPPPPVDWSRVDAALETRLASRKQRERRFVSGLWLWGTLATATAAAALVWVLAPRGPEAPARLREAPAAPVAEAVRSAGTSHGEGQAVLFDPFVVYVAGAASTASPGEPWSPLGLESSLEEGTRVRTESRGAAGLQLASGHGCRLEPETEVQITRLGAEEIRIELDHGRVVCRSAEREPEILLSVTDVVASATGNAIFAVERRPPRIVVIELAEGTLRVPRSATDIEVSAPGAAEVDRGPEGRELVVSPVEGDRLELPPVELMPRRSMASLQIPAAPGVDRVTVDGVEYGSLPLSLRHHPGSVMISLMAGGATPVTHEIEIPLGPRVVELASLLTPGVDESTPRPLERRIVPRVGTYTKTQQQRLASLVADRVRRCYERVLKRDPGVWGRIRVQLRVSTSGRAERVVVSSLAGGHPGINDCVQQGLTHEVFPPPQGGVVPVEQNITLSPRF
jgi:hypothetical protein